MSYGLLLGYASLVIAQVTIGINVTIGKYLLGIMPIHIFLCLRFFISAIGLQLFFMLARGGWLSPYHPTGKLEKKDWLMMITQGLFGGFFFNFLFIWGLDYTTATSAGIIGASLPVIISISAYFFLKEKMTLAITVAIVFAAAGIVVIALDNPSEASSDTGSFLGDFLILLAMFPEAWYSILGKVLANRVKPIAAATVANWTTVICFIPWAMPQAMTYSWHELTSFDALLIFIGGMSSLLFFWLWPWGLKYVSATEASLFGGLMPVSVCVLAVVCLGENFTGYEAVGMMFVFLSLWMGSKHGHECLAKLRKREKAG